MKNTKEAFIRLALECKALKFGQFTLKSGRISPYFFNAGLFYQGKALRALGQFYANALVDSQITFRHLFGPAYKGLPLATATSIALAEVGVDVTVTFNRKEKKEHGEGGELIGAPLTGNTVIVDDVVTAGTAFREAQMLINKYGGKLTAVMIALDRCEQGVGQQSAIKEIENQGIQVISLITLFDLIDYLKEQDAAKEVEQLLLYQKRYGEQNS